MTGRQSSPMGFGDLLSKFDVDPGPWRPLYYPVEISVPVGDGGLGRGSVTLNNQPFIWTQLAHQIIGATMDSQSGLYQDGMYTIEFKDEQSVYQKDPVMAELIAGSVRSGYQQLLPLPIPFAGQRTISFTIQNRVARTVGEATHFTVALCVIGFANWGTLAPRG